MSGHDKALVAAARSLLVSERSKHGGDDSRDELIARRLVASHEAMRAAWPRLRETLHVPAHFSEADRMTVMAELQRLVAAQQQLDADYASLGAIGMARGMALALTGADVSDQHPFDLHQKVRRAGN